MSRTPGFTAELSLGPKTGVYQGGALLDASAVVGVVPALPIDRLFGRCCCFKGWLCVPELPICIPRISCVSCPFSWICGCGNEETPVCAKPAVTDSF